MKARRVYYESDQESTQPDYQLKSSFEHTKPGGELDFEDAVTGEWFFPTTIGLGLLLGGFLIGRWWVTRKNEKSTVVAGEESGFDSLGAS